MLRIPRKGSQKFHYGPLRYPGGKTFLFSLFDKLIAKNRLGSVTYVEPFAGGAGAALALLLLEKVERVVINDLDRSIYAFWKAAIFDSDAFIHKLFLTPVTVREWKRQKVIYDRAGPNIFALGFAFFFLNRTNVSGLLNAGPIGGLKQTGRWKINARFNKRRLAEQIREVSLYRNRITVLNRDGIDLIKEYLGRKDVFIYLDPPYYEKGATLYLNHYGKSDHEALAEVLNRNRNAFWLLTYDDRPEISTLYSERRMVKFSLTYNVREYRKGKELLILSDALAI